jgi:pimeloyl-ACP methyl ester carboxylesterase
MNLFTVAQSLKWVYPILVFLGLVSVVFFSLGLHRKARYIRNFEAAEYGQGYPFMEPMSVIEELAEMLRSADETLNRLGIQDPVDVVGHSMGGFSGLAFAIEHPDRTRRLVEVDPRV